MSNSKKKRFIVVAGIIVIVIVLATAYLSAGTTASVMSVSDAISPDAKGKKVQVEGTVVDNSFSIDGDVLTFEIFGDGDGNSARTLKVRYDKGVAATFGNGVVAICTGTIDDNGVLVASELITKCPSKYETSNNALTIARLLDYGESIMDKPVKLSGVISDEGVSDVSSSVRFTVLDDGGNMLEVAYGGAIPDGIAEGTSVIVTGSLGRDGLFHATDLAIESGA